MPRGNGGIIGPVNTSFSGVWSLTEAQLRRSANTWPNFYAALLSESATGTDVFSGSDPSDPYFEYTTLLLPGNGTNGAQNNTFLDGSTNNFTITRNGNTTQGTFSPFSQTGWGNYFGGDGNYLSSAYSADFSFSTGEFSIECWANVSDAGRTADANKYGTFVSAGLTASSSGLWDFTFRIVGGVITEVTFGNAGVTVLTVTSQTITLNQWHHFVVCRSGSTFSFFVDGTRIGTTTYSTAVDMNASGSLRIAALAFFSTYQNWVNGYISNLRIIKGSSAYNAASSSITVPTTPLTSPTNTKLLTCQSNRFIDANTQVTAKTITLTGSPRVVAFSPFNPTASWSAATYGGSGYFDGNGDYLATPNNSALTLGSGDFTIEMWIFCPNTANGNIQILYDQRSASGQTVPTIYLDTNGYLQYFVAGANKITYSTAVTSNAWNHIAISRSGSNTIMFLNGAQVGSTYTTLDTLAGNAVGIGAYLGTPSLYYTGYMSNLRVVKGTAVYTGAFTPPTAPITDAGSTSAASYPSTTNVNTSFASSATSLLLNFTNAGIYDATSKNDLETVGNAQISTAISAKWGSGSMYFDGTGDWLKIPASTLWQFGTGDFTIEFWWYPNSLATYQQILSVTDNAGLTGAGQFSITYNTSLGLRFFINAGATAINQGSTSGWSAGQWYYIAAVRSGNTLTLYRNGSSIASGSVTGVTIGANVPVYIGGEQYTPHSNNGYLQDVRITNGYARTVTTSPTAAFPTL